MLLMMMGAMRTSAVTMIWLGALSSVVVSLAMAAASGDNGSSSSAGGLDMLPFPEGKNKKGGKKSTGSLEWIYVEISFIQGSNICQKIVYLGMVWPLPQPCDNRMLGSYFSPDKSQYQIWSRQKPLR